MNSTQLLYLRRKPINLEDVARYREEATKFIRIERSVFEAITAISKVLESPVAHKDVKIFIARRKGFAPRLFGHWHKLYDTRRNPQMYSMTKLRMQN